MNTENIHSGIIRRLDDLRRVVIPKEICREAKIGEDSPVEIALVKMNGKHSILLTPYRREDEKVTQVRKLFRNLMTEMWPKKFPQFEGGITLIDAHDILSQPKNQQEQLVGHLSNILYCEYGGVEQKPCRASSPDESLHAISMPLGYKDGNQTSTLCCAVLYSTSTIEHEVASTFESACTVATLMVNFVE